MRRLWVFLISLLWVDPATATDVYSYKAKEYVIISGGKSPDGHWSVAAHGEGSDGSDHFGLYLMREPAHERSMQLPTGEHLDTAPLSIAGVWAPDSSCVAVLYRSDRHVLELRLVAVANGKSQALDVPALVNAVGHDYLKPAAADALSSRHFRVAWKGKDQLALEEFDAFDATDSVFRPGIETYLNVDRRGPERTFTDFSASAICDISDRKKPHFLDIKPMSGKWEKIVYSPHLLFEPGSGLHSTETAMSSMEAQAERDKGHPQK